jgi:hypothetical protein
MLRVHLRLFCHPLVEQGGELGGDGYKISLTVAIVAVTSAVRSVMYVSRSSEAQVT